jgi:hypothetical protein
MADIESEENATGETLSVYLSFSREQLASPHFERFLDTRLALLKQEFMRKRRDCGYELPVCLKGEEKRG